MRVAFWLVLVGFVLTAAGLVWQSRRKLQAMRRAEEARFAALLAEATVRKSPVALPPGAPTQSAASLPPAATSAQNDGLPQQKLLFESARKAGEAGEPALAVQLYARLLARYPGTAFAAQVRSEVDAQKKKLAMARSPSQNSG